MDYYFVFGLAAVALSFISYIPYIYHLFKNKTKPHIFSWFLWGLLSGIAFLAQINENAGPGSWVVGFTAAICLFIAAASYIKYKKDYVTKFDWVCFITAIFGVILWVVTDNALNAVIVVTVVDALAFIPTFRKTFINPHEETIITFTFSAVTMALSLAALENFNLTTALYPASLVFTNILFVLMTLARRKNNKTSRAGLEPTTP